MTAQIAAIFIRVGCDNILFLEKTKPASGPAQTALITFFLIN